jgi:S1-C subfamily serine protease
MSPFVKRLDRPETLLYVFCVDADAKDKDYLLVIDVEKDSPAARAGLKVQDVLVSFDGAAVPDRETLSRAMAAKRWGDAAAVVVRRGEANVPVPVLLRREPPAAAKP